MLGQRWPANPTYFHTLGQRMHVIWGIHCYVFEVFSHLNIWLPLFRLEKMYRQLYHIKYCRSWHSWQMMTSESLLESMPVTLTCLQTTVSACQLFYIQILKTDYCLLLDFRLFISWIDLTWHNSISEAGVIRAYDALVTITSRANLKFPSLIRSTNMRKYMATMTQVYSCSPNFL
jgi:hypothetical protein